MRTPIPAATAASKSRIHAMPASLVGPCPFGAGPTASESAIGLPMASTCAGAAPLYPSTIQRSGSKFVKGAIVQSAALVAVVASLLLTYAARAVPNCRTSAPKAALRAPVLLEAIARYCARADASSSVSAASKLLACRVSGKMRTHNSLPLNAVSSRTGKSSSGTCAEGGWRNLLVEGSGLPFGIAARSGAEIGKAVDGSWPASRSVVASGTAHFSAF